MGGAQPGILQPEVGVVVEREPHRFDQAQPFDRGPSWTRGRTSGLGARPRRGREDQQDRDQRPGEAAVAEAAVVGEVLEAT